MYEADKTRTGYGKTVGIVIRDRMNLNLEFILAGYAWVYDQYCTRPECKVWEFIEAKARDGLLSPGPGGEIPSRRKCSLLDGTDSAGIGMTPFQVLTKVEHPLASPIIMAGVRIGDQHRYCHAGATNGAGGLESLLSPGSLQEIPPISSRVHCSLDYWQLLSILF
jgi:hypothetical protein